MSRCFPFPPPGYEKRLRNSEQESLLSKEKHKEKKHKKERKEKDQVENKEINDNGRSRDKHSDGSRDKHKEKQDKKERHKDKKRKKEKDNIGSSSNPDNETLVANETKDSKFKEELGRRIRDEEQAATNCMAKNISNTTNRKIENSATDTSTTAGKESFTTNKTIANGSVFMHRKIDKPIPPFHQSRTDGSEIPSTSNEKQKTASRYNIQQFTSLEKRNDKNVLPLPYKRTEGIETPPASIENRINGGSERKLTPPNDKHTPLFHNRRTEGIETLTSIEKQKIGGSEKITPPMLKNFNDINKRKVQINQKVGNFATEDRRNHVTTRPFDEFPRQKVENIYAVNSNQKVRNSNMASNANGLSTESNNELERLVGSITSIPESTSSAQATEKERCLFPNIIFTEAEKKNKKELENAKTERSHKDRDGNEKNKKRKDRDKQKKKEEKKKMKIEQKLANHVKTRDIEMKDQINDSNGKSIAAPHLVNLNASIADGHNKKRKEPEMNGLLCEPQLDERPNKLPRTDASSSHQLMKNGNTLDSNNGASKLVSINNVTIKRGMENNGKSINGKAKIELQPSHVPKPTITPITLDPKKTSVAIESSKKDRIRTRPPHRDTKYLDTIYSIPKLEEIPEPNDQDWLFSEMKHAAKTNTETKESPPKVWAQGLRIDEADVFALPYVVPF